MPNDFVPVTIDAKVWASEFCKRFPTMDEGTMIGWFANAIMAGFDEAEQRSQREPRVGTPERLEWQRRKNAEALRMLDEVALAPPYKGSSDASS